MMLDTTYIISWLVFFLLLGAIWYALDGRYGVLIYRWLYNLTHEHPLPPGLHQGFIFNRRAKERFSAATLLCVLQSVLVVLTVKVNPLVELLTFFFEVPVLMLGFYLGPAVSRIWASKDSVLATVDKLESGEVSITGEIKQATQIAADAVRDALHLEAAPPDEATAPDTERQPEPQPEALMNRYLRKE